MKKTPKPKKSAKKRRLHRRAGGPDPARVTRNAIARELGTTLPTVIRWMAVPGAPGPDDYMRFDRPAALDWCRKQSTWAIGGASGETHSLRDQKLQLELAELKRQDAVRRGELFERKDWDDEATAFVVDVETTHRNLFYHELPPKLVGKSEQEIREMIDGYLLEAANKIRASAARVEAKLEHAKEL